MDTEDFTPPNSPCLTKHRQGMMEGAGADFITEGAVTEKGTEEMRDEDDMLQSKDHAKYGAQKHLFLLLP